VVFKPKNMTPHELQAGEIWVKKEFSKLSSIVKHLPWNLHHPLLYLAMNLGIRANAKADALRLPTLDAELFQEKSHPSRFQRDVMHTGESTFSVGS
jgi:hypothetical protein